MRRRRVEEDAANQVAVADERNAVNVSWRTALAIWLGIHRFQRTLVDAKRFAMPKVQVYLLVVLVCNLFSRHAIACPFCSAISQSFAEEMEAMDVVAIAKFKSRKRSTASDLSNPQEEVPLSDFEFTHVIKGDEHVKTGGAFQVLYLGTARKDDRFLVMASSRKPFDWSTPLALTDRVEEYLRELPTLPTGPARLEFFQNHLEDSEEILAGDAYNEFARAPYSELVALKSKMNRRRLLEFISDPKVPALRRKLYFTMLGVCGTREDAKLLEEFMTSEDRKSGLDAMLACYLNLAGGQGLDRIDELFLANPNADYVDINAAVVALRFHGDELNVISRERLLQSLRLVLEISSLADLVIADLARWEDWDAIPKLCELFVEADEESSFVRVPVVNYLRSCPLPIAKEKIEELKLIDADAVQYATTEPSLGDSELATDHPMAKPNVGGTHQARQHPSTLPVASPIARKSIADKAKQNYPLLVGGLVCLLMVVLITVVPLKIKKKS